MSRLTWQNVSAPDFGGSTQSLGLAADLFDRAFSRANVGVGQAKGLFEDQAEAELARRLMSFQDEDALGTAIQSGDIWDGINAKYLSPEAMMSAGKQQDTLLGRERDRFGLKAAEQSFDIRAAEFEDYNEDRDYRDSQRETMKQAGTLYSQFAEGLYSPDPAVQAEAQKGFNAGLAGLGLSYPQFRGMVQDGRSDGISRYNTEKDRFRFGIEQYDFSERLEDDAAEDEAQRIAMEIGQNYSDPAMIEQVINNMDLSPKVYGRVRGLAGLGSGGGGGSSGSSSGGFSGGQDAMSILREFEGFRTDTYWDVNHHRVGYGSDTITLADGTVRTVKKGDKVSKADAERDLARRTSIIADFASQKAGNGWGNLSEGARAAITSVAYNYGQNSKRLKPLWEAAKTGDNVAVANVIRSFARDNNGVNANRRNREAALAVSTPVSPREALANNVVVETGTAEQTNTFSVNPFAKSYYNSRSVNAQLNMSEAINEVKRMEPRFAKAPDKQIQDDINFVMAEARKRNLPMNMAQAANFLVDSTRSSDWWNSDFFDVVNGRSTLRLDPKILRQGLDYIKNGGGKGEIAGRNSINLTKAEQQADAENLAKAEAAWQRAQTLRVGSPERQRAYENVVEARKLYRLGSRTRGSSEDVTGENSRRGNGTGPVARTTSRRGNALPSSVDLFRDFRR